MPLPDGDVDVLFFSRLGASGERRDAEPAVTDDVDVQRGRAAVLPAAGGLGGQRLHQRPAAVLPRL